MDTIIELLATCVYSTYFPVAEKFYKQEFGVAMELPLSPILSKVHTEEIKEINAKNTSISKKPFIDLLVRKNNSI